LYCTQNLQDARVNVMKENLDVIKVDFNRYAMSTLNFFTHASDYSGHTTWIIVKIFFAKK